MKKAILTGLVPLLLTPQGLVLANENSFVLPEGESTVFTLPKSKLEQTIAITLAHKTKAEMDSLQAQTTQDGITIIADSLLVGMNAAFHQRVPNGNLDAKISRWMNNSKVGFDLDGLQILKQHRQNGSLQPNVVLALGTNGGVSYTDLEEMIQAMPPYVERVFFVDTNSNVDHKNQVHDAMARVAQNYPNVYHLSWKEYSDYKGRDQFYGSDNIHFSNPQAYLDFILIGIQEVSKHPLQQQAVNMGQWNSPQPDIQGLPPMRPGSFNDGLALTGQFLQEQFKAFPTDPRNSQISYWYGDPYYPGSSFHYGYDISYHGYVSGNVYAVEDGIVTKADDSGGWNEGAGNYVEIAHPNFRDGTYLTNYYHLEYATVNVGDVVRAGDVIGMMGTTGNSTGIHVHFEVEHGIQNKVDPYDMAPWENYATILHPHPTGYSSY